VSVNEDSCVNFVLIYMLRDFVCKQTWTVQSDSVFTLM